MDLSTVVGVEAMARPASLAVAASNNQRSTQATAAVLMAEEGAVMLVVFAGQVAAALEEETVEVLPAGMGAAGTWIMPMPR